MAGTKRKPPAKVAAPADFKRRTAKVGRKAGKSLNETDTTFKKASLHVARQAPSTPSAGSIISQKGKSLLDLSMQASHPAAQARRSAIKGLLNILTAFEPNKLRAHLHVFLQIASIGLVDEDPDVRKAGYNLLEEILAKYDEPSLSPFLPLIVAYTCSGLHSLDRHMRVDGARTADIMCSYFYSTLTLENAKLILPPFVGLLADNRDKNLIVVLKALVKTLMIVSSNCNQNDDNDANCPSSSSDFVYRTGGRSRNAFIQIRRRPTKPAIEFSTLHNLSSSFRSYLRKIFASKEIVADRRTLTGKSSLCSVLADIQKKLCDVLVELTDVDTEPGQKREISSAIAATTTVVQAIYLSTKAYIIHMDGSKMDRDERLVNILFDLFPINGRFASSESVGEAQENEKCNALITKVLLLFDVIVDSKEQSMIRMNTLVSYWIPSIDKAERWSSCHLDVLHELMAVFSSHPTRFLNSRKKVLKEICGLFLRAPNREVARSAVGRKVAIMLSHACVQELKLESRDETFLADTMMSLPTYLQMWSSDFQEETLVVVDSMHLVVCANSDAQNTVDEVVRERISVLFQKSEGKPSTFEALSSKVRYSILGLIRILGKPSKAILKSLSATCALDGPACSLSAAEIFGTIYSLRKSISMADYLSFVVGSIGVPRLSETLPSNEAFLIFITCLDFRVSRGAKAAVECGSLKSLKMLTPQLMCWMETPEGCSPLSRALLVRCRVALCFVSILLAQLAKSCISVDAETEVRLLLGRCTAASGHMIDFLAGSDGITNQVESRLLAPIVALANMDNGFKSNMHPMFLSSTNANLPPRLAEIFQKIDSRCEAQLHM